MNLFLKLFKKEEEIKELKVPPHIAAMTLEEKLAIVNKHRMAEGKNPLSLNFELKSLSQEEKQKIINDCNSEKNKKTNEKER